MSVIVENESETTVTEMKKKILKTGMSKCCKRHLCQYLEDSIDTTVPVGMSAEKHPEAYHCVTSYGCEKLGKNLGIKIEHMPNRQYLVFNFQTLRSKVEKKTA